MNGDDAGELLDRIGLFRHPCDLDLLLFFVAHPRTLLTSENLAAFMGYELKQIADSLETLLAAGLLKRTQTQTHAARLYILETDSVNNERLAPFLAMASTRKGRGALRRALAKTSNERGGPVAGAPQDIMGIRNSRSLLVRRKQLVAGRRSPKRGGM